MGREIAYKEAKFGLFARETVAEDGAKHTRVLYVEMGKQKASDKALDKLPAFSWHKHLQKEVPIKELDGAVPPWIKVQPILTPEDQAKLAQIEKGRREAKEQAAKAKERKGYAKEFVKKVNTKSLNKAQIKAEAAKLALQEAKKDKLKLADVL